MGRNLTSFSRKGSTFSRRRRRDAFSSIFDTWFDTQYLTGPDVCLWTRPKDHEQPFFSIFSCVIVDRLSRLIILDAAGCARKKEREREGKIECKRRNVGRGREGVRVFPVEQPVDSSMKLRQDAWAFHFTLFFWFQSTLIDPFHGFFLFRIFLWQMGRYFLRIKFFHQQMRI